jgi:hypothetical protein
VTKANYISVGAQTIEVTVIDASIPFGNMASGETKTGSTTVNVAVTGGTAWSVTAKDLKTTNKGFMTTPTDVKLTNPFKLANDGSTFKSMELDFADFMTGSAGVPGSGTASVSQLIGADTPGAYSITLTFTGAFS